MIAGGHREEEVLQSKKFVYARLECFPMEAGGATLWNVPLYMMSNERIGYLLLGIILAAAVLYGFLSFVGVRTEPKFSSQAEPSEGETPFPPGDELDAILRSLPTSERPVFDPALVEWVSYSDGTDHFFLERPRGWDITETASPSRPEARRITVSEGQAAFAIYPQGEFDYGLPDRNPMETALELDGRASTMREWALPDGSWLAVVTLNDKPKGGFRIELTVLNPSVVSQKILREMLARFRFTATL
jgi:hypothetical protein